MLDERSADAATAGSWHGVQIVEQAIRTGGQCAVGEIERREAERDANVVAAMNWIPAAIALSKRQDARGYRSSFGTTP
jgi:hypothetical protein